MSKPLITVITAIHAANAPTGLVHFHQAPSKLTLVLPFSFWPRLFLWLCRRKSTCDSMIFLPGHYYSSMVIEGGEPLWPGTSPNQAKWIMGFNVKHDSLQGGWVTVFCGLEWSERCVARVPLISYLSNPQGSYYQFKWTLNSLFNNYVENC